MLPLAGRPVIEHVIERVQQITGLSDVILATSEDSSDDVIADWSGSAGVSLFRGPLDDVLGRYYECATQAKADLVVRVTADCPILDPSFSSRAVSLAKSEKSDLVALGKSFPKGLDTQVFRMSALKTAFSEATNPYDREHVGPFIEKDPERFSIITIETPADYSDLRLTLDYPEDYEFLQGLLTNFEGPASSLFFKEVLEVVEAKRDLIELNRVRNLGAKNHEGKKAGNAV